MANMNNRERFFYEHAGSSYDPKVETAAEGAIRGAKELAKAELYALEQDWKFEIAPDTDVDIEDSEAWYCTLWDAEHKNLLASLSGCTGDSNYERVVKAELALEAMAMREARRAKADGYVNINLTLSVCKEDEGTVSFVLWSEAGEEASGSDIPSEDAAMRIGCALLKAAE